MRQEKAEGASNVVTGTFSIHDRPLDVLLDSGATHSFISAKLVEALGLTPISGPPLFSTTLPDGKVVGCEEFYENCPIRMYEQLFLADLNKFALTDFGVILGMDWLARYQAQINCPRQRITLKGPNGERIVHNGKALRTGVRLITTLKASKLLGRGCEGFLCNVVETAVSEPLLQDIPVV